VNNPDAAKSVTFPVQFRWFDGSSGRQVLVLFPSTNQYIELSPVAARDFHAQLTAFLQQTEPKSG
jgi:hypothetical protein